MQNEKEPFREKKTVAPLRRILLEVSFIIFLFYSNLLMGEYTHSGAGNKHGILWAINDIFTLHNFSIALLTSLVAYIIFDYMLKRGR